MGKPMEFKDELEDIMKALDEDEAEQLRNEYAIDKATDI